MFWAALQHTHLKRVFPNAAPAVYSIIAPAYSPTPWLEGALPVLRSRFNRYRLFWFQHFPLLTSLSPYRRLPGPIVTQCPALH